MVFCPLDLPFRESRERCKFLQFKVDPPSSGRLEPKFTQESKETSCRWRMPMPTRTTRTTTGCTRRSYQLDASAVLTNPVEDKLSPPDLKTNLKTHQRDAIRFIRKLSTGRDTGFRESGSRAILNRTFSLDPVRTTEIPQGKVTFSLEPHSCNRKTHTNAWTIQPHLWTLEPKRCLETDFRKFFGPGDCHPYHLPRQMYSIPFSVLESAYYHILQCWFG